MDIRGIESKNKCVLKMQIGTRRIERLIDPKVDCVYSHLLNMIHNEYYFFSA
jgi:hypothetical protein